MITPMYYTIKHECRGQGVGGGSHWIDKPPQLQRHGDTETLKQLQKRLLLIPKYRHNYFISNSLHQRLLLSVIVSISCPSTYLQSLFLVQSIGRNNFKSPDKQNTARDQNSDQIIKSVHVRITGLMGWSLAPQSVYYSHCMCQHLQMRLFNRILVPHLNRMPLKRFHFGDVNFCLEKRI